MNRAAGPPMGYHEPVESRPANPKRDAYVASARDLFSRALKEEGLPQGMAFAAFSPSNPFAGLYDYALGQIQGMDERFL